MLMLLYDSVHVVVIDLNFGLLLGHNRYRRKEVESFPLQPLDCIERKIHLCTVLLKDKLVTNKALNSTEHFVEVERDLSMTFTPCLMNNNSNFRRSDRHDRLGKRRT